MDALSVISCFLYKSYIYISSSYMFILIYRSAPLSSIVKKMMYDSMTTTALGAGKRSSSCRSGNFEKEVAA